MISGIELTKIQLRKIHENFYWNYGGESNIYRIPFLNKYILLKLFYNPSREEFFLPDVALKNKEEKISWIIEHPLPNYIHPIMPAFYQKKFIGYILNQAIDYQNFCFNQYNTYEQITFLRKLKNQLQQFHSLNIFYGDLKSDNVLSHMRVVKGCLCDLDNMWILENPFDIMPEYVEGFLHQYGEIDECLDWYVLNLLTIEAIYNLDTQTYTPYTETRDFLRVYEGKSEVMKEMQHINCDYSGRLLIEDPVFLGETNFPYCLK